MQTDMDNFFSLQKTEIIMGKAKGESPWRNYTDYNT